MTIKNKIVIGVLLLASATLSACDGPVTNVAPTPTPVVQSENQRLLSIEGTRNFRDLGGYKTQDGRTVKWGHIYRSDNLAELKKDGLKALAALDLAVITDLRSEPERDEAPDKLPKQEPPIRQVTLDVNTHAVDIRRLTRQIMKGEMDEHEVTRLLDHNQFIENPAILEEWGQWVRSLAEPGNIPQLHHCTSGKDRAGFASAILLLTLGVPKETVMEDFLLSNEILAEYNAGNIKKIQRFAKEGTDMEIFRTIMGVQEQTLRNAFALMETEYGSIDGFIEIGLGVDTQTRLAVQELLLE